MGKVTHPVLDTAHMYITDTGEYWEVPTLHTNIGERGGRREWSRTVISTLAN